MSNDHFAISPADLRAPAQLGTPFSAPVMESHQQHQHLQGKDHSSRVDRRGERSQTETGMLPPYGAPSRGPVERRVISREEALSARAAQGAAQQATSDPEAFHALKVELEAQRALATRQAAQIQQLLERLDAIDGSPEAA
jgi:hypothetical protein